MKTTQISSSMKDYLSTIYFLSKEKEENSKSGNGQEQPIIRVKDIATALGVAPPSVVEYVQRLRDQGVVEVYPRKGVSLTKEGIKEAKILANRYKIVQCFFANILHVDKEIADSQANTIEHLMAPIVIKQLYNHIDGIIGCPNNNCNLEELCSPQ